MRFAEFLSTMTTEKKKSNEIMQEESQKNSVQLHDVHEVMKLIYLLATKWKGHKVNFKFANM